MTETEKRIPGQERTGFCGSESFMPDEKEIYGNNKKAPLWFRSFLTGERCLVCHDGATGGRDLLCSCCNEKLERETGWICPHCGAEISSCLCPTEDMKKAGVEFFVKLYPYLADGSLVSGRLLYRLKTRRDRLLSYREAFLLSQPLKNSLRAVGISPRDVIVTYIPRTRRRVNKSGTDQGRELCLSLAEALGAEYGKLIKRSPGGSVQKTLDSGERLINAWEAFEVPDSAGLEGKCVVIADDLVTTGATMAGCAMKLYAAGAGIVVCAALSHTVGRGAGYFPAGNTV